MEPNPVVEELLGTLRRGGYSPASAAAFGSGLAARSRLTAAANPGLVRELRVVRRLGLLLAVGAGLWIVREGVPVVPGLLLPAGAWVLLGGWVWAELGLLRHPLTGRVVGHLGVANMMTLYRGWAAVPVLLLGLYQRGPTPAWVVLCLSAGLTDLVDGTVAIRLHQESRLGRLLDPVLDACFFSAAAACLAIWHLLPGWLAALVALRYFAPVIGGLAILLATGRSLPVRHTPWGQRSTAATALALLVTWASAYVRLPQPVLPVLYAVAVVFMAFALGGILRRAPRGG